jgi:hypothetical protein
VSAVSAGWAFSSPPELSPESSSHRRPQLRSSSENSPQWRWPAASVLHWAGHSRAKRNGSPRSHARRRGRNAKRGMGVRCGCAFYMICIKRGRDSPSAPLSSIPLSSRLKRGAAEVHARKGGAPFISGYGSRPHFHSRKPLMPRRESEEREKAQRSFRGIASRNKTGLPRPKYSSCNL